MVPVEGCCCCLVQGTVFLRHASLLRSVGRQLVNIPSFLVRLDSEKHIDYALTSPFGSGRPGRVKRKSAGAAGGGDGEEED